MGIITKSFSEPEIKYLIYSPQKQNKKRRQKKERKEKKKP